MLTLNQQISSIRNDLANLKINSADFSGGIIEVTVSTLINLDNKVDEHITDICNIDLSLVQ